jgi:hypothetical protein
MCIRTETIRASGLRPVTAALRGMLGAVLVLQGAKDVWGGVTA